MSDPQESGSDQPSDCPECGGSGFVTGDTGPGEAECLDEDCPEGVFEVRDDGLRADGGEPQETEKERSRFPFEEGDTVLVRAREAGTAGNIVAKFEATCERISESGVGTSPKARFEMPFGTMNSVSIRPYEAEFEVIDDE